VAKKKKMSFTHPLRIQSAQKQANNDDTYVDKTDACAPSKKK
jgi:hypothetical protein